MRGRIDVHRHEREETDIRLFEPGPLVPGPAELTDLRTDVGTVRSQQCGRNPQPADHEHQHELPPAVGATRQLASDPDDHGMHGTPRTAMRGIVHMLQHDAENGGRRALDFFMQPLMPSCEIPRQYALTPSESDQCHDDGEKHGEGKRQNQHVGPAEAVQSHVVPVQRPDGAAPCQPQTCQYGQRPTAEAGESRTTAPGFSYFGHIRHITVMARMRDAPVARDPPQFMASPTRLDEYEFRSG